MATPLLYIHAAFNALVISALHSSYFLHSLVKGGPVRENRDVTFLHQSTADF